MHMFSIARAALFSSLVLSSVLFGTLAGCVGKGGFQMGSGSSGTSSSGTSSSGDGTEETSSYAGPASVSGGGSSAAKDAGPSEPRWDDFAFAVRERTGTYYGPWIISKFTTFKVGKACWEKMADAKADPVNTASYYIRNVYELAKTWTNEDWDRIENQHSDRSKDRKFVEPLMDKFGEQFHMTIAIEGDDCGVASDSLWLRYWYAIAEAFAKYPPAAGKVFVTLNVTDTRDIAVEVDETGSQFTFTAPRDIEPASWTEKLEKPFRRVARKL
jgi:hypothetical protein